MPDLLAEASALAEQQFGPDLVVEAVAAEAAVFEPRQQRC